MMSLCECEVWSGGIIWLYGVCQKVVGSVQLLESCLGVLEILSCHMVSSGLAFGQLLPSLLSLCALLVGVACCAMLVGCCNPVVLLLGFCVADIWVI